MKKQRFAVGLGVSALVLVLVTLLATSFVSARPLAADMDSRFQTIPAGSTHSSYDGDYVSGDRTIDLQSGWSTNLPIDVCAIAVRFAFKDNAANHWASLRPSNSGAHGVLVRTQVANQWTDDAGIVPLNSPNGDMYLDVSSAGYVYIQITGYWTCDDYVRPTLGAPAADD